MALKDLKSDLSKFRIPKQEPLINKKVDSVPKNVNQTPLSNYVDNTPKISKLKTTSDKIGIEPKSLEQGDKFKGETTTPNYDNTEKFKGETKKPTYDSTEKFKGETSPISYDTTEKFKGQTTPNEYNNTEKFKGETKKPTYDDTEQFKGETSPVNYNNIEKFKGETSPTNYDNTEKFKGQTSPVNYDDTEKFKGQTSPTNYDNTEKFKGQTSTANYDNTEKFKGQTSPVNYDDTEKFKGETSTTNFTFNPNHENRGTTPTEINYFSDIHATGFNSRFQPGSVSKFVGINSNQTQFDRTNSLYSNTSINTFTLGRTYFDSFESAGGANSGQGGFGIGKAHNTRNSPSFLDLQYAKFNLKDDSFNSCIGVRHPLVLRGIQRKQIGKGEPQRWGGLATTCGVEFIRGGILTSTERAAIDVFRLSSWLASAKGVSWSIQQVGLQRTNRYGKIWTPANLLLAVGGQHAGIKPPRAGVLPISDTYSYENIATGNTLIQTANFYTGLTDIYKTYDRFSKIGGNFGVPGVSPIWKSDLRGGFDSFYGIGTTNTTRYVNTFSNKEKNFNDSVAVRGVNEISAGNIKRVKFGYTPYTTSDDPYINPQTGNPKTILTDNFIKDLVDDTSGNKTASPSGNHGIGNPFNKKVRTDGGDLHKLEQKTGTDALRSYETVAYGKLPDRPDAYNDFRKLLSDNNPNRKIAESDNYSENNLQKRTNFGNPGEVGKDKSNWWNITKDGDGYDKVNASDIGEESNDLIHLWFQNESAADTKIQFRGIVSGITETFTPGWEGIKYNGRADEAFKYSTFSRTLSFNFKVVATSRIEMKPIWKKLRLLSSMTMPVYGGDAGYNGIINRFRLGNLYNNKLCIIESLSYTYMDDIAWEISMLGSNEPLGEIPMGVDVSIGLKILGDELPTYDSKVFDMTWIK